MKTYLTLGFALLFLAGCAYYESGYTSGYEHAYITPYGYTPYYSYGSIYWDSYPYVYPYGVYYNHRHPVPKNVRPRPDPNFQREPADRPSKEIDRPSPSVPQRHGFAPDRQFHRDGFGETQRFGGAGRGR